MGRRSLRPLLNGEKKIPKFETGAVCVACFRSCDVQFRGGWLGEAFGELLAQQGSLQWCDGSGLGRESGKIKVVCE